MEFASAIVLAVVLIAGGGATGAYHEDGHEECYAEDGETPEECEEHFEDCPYHDDVARGAQRGGGCC
jgi:hypothetical protein